MKPQPFYERLVTADESESLLIFGLMAFDQAEWTAAQRRKDDLQAHIHAKWESFWMRKAATLAMELMTLEALEESNA